MQIDVRDKFLTNTAFYPKTKQAGRIVPYAKPMPSCPPTILVKSLPLRLSNSISD